MPQARLKVGAICLAVLVSCIALAGCVASGNSTSDLNAAPEAAPQVRAQIAASTDFASAAELRAPHGEDLLDELQLSYDVFNSATERTHQVMLGIGPDYVHVTQGAVRTIYDFGLRRVIDVDLEQGRYFDYSLYGEVYSLNQELVSRTMLAEILDSTLPGVPIAADVQQAFWRESVLGTAPKPAGQLEVAETDGLVVFQEYHRNIVQFFPAKAIDPSANEIALFYKFMRLALTAHPTIVVDLEARGGLPQALVLRKPDGEESAWALTLFERVGADYPLPPNALLGSEPVDGWESDIWHEGERHLAVRYLDDGLFVSTTEAPTMEPILPIMIAAVAGRHGNGPPVIDDWLNRMQIATETDALFEAGLLSIELTLMWGTLLLDCSEDAGPPYCKRWRDTVSQSQHDQRVRFAWGSMTTLEVERALKIWATLPKGDAPTSYLIDLFLANRFVTTRLAEPQHAVTEGKEFRSHSAKAFELFVSAISGNPYNPSAYKDLGDFYSAQHDYRRAWIAFDLGRRLPNADYMPNLTLVSDFEAELVAQYPQFF